MVNQRLRRAGLPVAVSAAVAAAAVVATLMTNGTAGAETTPAAPAATVQVDRATVAKAVEKAVAQSKIQAAGKRSKANKSAARSATDELNFGDLTDDGKADLAAVDKSGTMWVYPGKAYEYSGTGPRSTSLFSARIKIGTGWGKFNSLVRHGDFNGDGLQDVLTRDSSGRLFFYAGTGNPAAIFKKGTQAGTGWGGFTSIAGGGDLNGDGFDDLLGQKATGELVLYYGTGKPATPFRAKGSVIGTGWKGDLLTSIGDVTGDGRTEWYFRNTAKAVYMYESKSGSFPIGSRTEIFKPGDGDILKNIVGMGNLTSDADSAFGVLPDMLFQFTDGSLFVIAADVDNSESSTFDPQVGTGWGGYRLF